ncbi:MAG: hypothetical protein JWR35_2391 [Marmoricola sp.]|nr:hypothetical protein [Marmoricola sp.]
MRRLTGVFVLGIVLLGVGFAVGVEPTTARGNDCGSVLFASSPGATHKTEIACRSTHDGRRRIATWGPLVLGGTLLLGAWTVTRESGSGRRADRAAGLV